MPIVEKITHEDLIVYEIMRNPVLFSEFVGNFDKTEWEGEFTLTDYQRDMMCDFNSHVSITTARATGKTTAESYLLTWALVYKLYPNDYIVYTVPNKVHLEPVWLNLVRQFRSNSLLKEFIKPNAGINSSDHRINLINNSELICRIAGQSGTGANIIGLHTPFVCLDEGGYYPWGTWTELQPILNTFTRGFRLLVAGVPTGLRENNVLYSADKDNSNYTKHRISAYKNPRFTEEDEQRALEQYGGKDNDDFIHLVLGEHGAAIFSVFDRRLFEIGTNDVYKLTVNGIELRENLGKYIEKLAILPKAPKNNGIVMGIDLGYTDPTAIFILYMDNTGKLRFHAKIQLNKVSYSIQDKFIDLLDTKFKPSIIGVDAGSSGKAVTQRLLDAEEFLHKEYTKRLIPIEFAQSIEMGFDADGKEIKTRAKPLAVSILQEYSNNHKIAYSTRDLETVAELERMTYSKNPSGDITYKTLTPKGGKRGEDHFTAALLCAALAYYLENEKLDARRRIPKLFKPRWFV